MYPYGDSQSDKTLSVFLCAVDRKQLPGWSQTAHYQIAVVNKDPSKTSTHTGYDIFRGKRDSAVSTTPPHCNRSLSGCFPAFPSSHASCVLLPDNPSKACKHHPCRGLCRCEVSLCFAAMQTGILRVPDALTSRCMSLQWGWSKLINLSKLHDVSQGWVDDEGKITLQVDALFSPQVFPDERSGSSLPPPRSGRSGLCG